jgi:SAM-dependent methyltransferase
MKQHIEFLAEYVSKGGPSEEERKDVDLWIESVSKDMLSQKFSDDEIDEFRAFIGKSLPVDTMYGLSLHKPHGYPGDFEIIDKIYTYYVCPKEEYTNWDFYYQERGSARAVRNRKEYFKRLLKAKITDYPEGFTVLNIASGPCRDLVEFFEENPAAKVKVTCIETDANAIQYAQNLLGTHAAKVDFLHTNIFKFKSTDTYDFIWCAGLYDYFNDAAFKGITKKLIGCTNPGGEIVVGNFAKTSPDVFYMHIVNWILHYRSPEDLVQLAQECGIPAENTHTYIGPEKVSLIFHMKCGQHG